MPLNFNQACKSPFIRLVGVLALVYGLVWVFYAQPALLASRLSRELFVWPLTLGLLWSYWQGYHFLRKGPVPPGWLFAAAVLLAIIAAFIPPFHSTDLYGYINRGWQQVHYGMNPYVYTIDHVPGWETDPMITNHWVNNPSPYGFLYMIVVKWLCVLGGGVKAQTVGVFKVFNLLIHLSTAALIWHVTRLVEAEDVERQQKLALYLYAFNPLVLLHGLANGHNDMLMGFWMLLSAYLVLKRAWLWLLPCLTAATLAKYGSLVTIPPAILLLILQRQWRALVLGGMLSALVSGLCGLPYLPDWQSFHLKEIGRNALVSHGSLHSCIFSLTKAFLDGVWPVIGSLNQWTATLAEAKLEAAKLTLRDVFKNLLILFYLAFYVSLGWRRFRQGVYSGQKWVRDALLVMAVLIGVVSLKFYPWYLGMFFPLAFCLRPGHWLRRLVILVSAAQLFSLTFIGQAHILNFLVMTGLPVLFFVFYLNKKERDVSGYVAARPDAA